MIGRIVAGRGEERSVRRGPEAEGVGAEEARHDDAKAESVGARLGNSVLERLLEAHRVALLLPTLTTERRNGADARDGLLRNAAGVAIGTLAHLGEVGKVLGHPAAGAGDDWKGPHENQGLLPSLSEADDNATNEGGHVLHEDGAAN